MYYCLARCVFIILPNGNCRRCISIGKVCQVNFLIACWFRVGRYHSRKEYIRVFAENFSDVSLITARGVHWRSNRSCDKSLLIHWIIRHLYSVNALTLFLSSLKIYSREISSILPWETINDAGISKLINKQVRLINWLQFWF